jgi:predicted nucleic acid-binding Zn ribbon protein
MPKCLMCGKDIPEGRKFCSLSCGTRHRNLSRNRHPVLKICEQCGKEYTVKYYHKDISKFCSDECHLDYLRRNNRLEPCSYCGKPVEVNWKRRNRKRYYCNNDCYNRSRSETKETVICSGCGKPYTIFRSQKNLYLQHYCTRACYLEHGNISTTGYVTNEKYEHLRRRLCQTSEYLKWKHEVLERDGFTCTISGDTKDLRVHHKMPLYKIVYKYNPTLDDNLNTILSSPEFNDVSNGVTLCNSCHMKEHHQSK